jgi:hypothetical protein
MKQWLARVICLLFHHDSYIAGRIPGGIRWNAALQSTTEYGWNIERCRRCGDVLGTPQCNVVTTVEQEQDS